MIQTVKGKISKEDVKKALVHEHISCVSGHLLHDFGKAWLDKEFLLEYAARCLKIAKKKYGLNLFVDGTISEAGRDVGLLKAVSEKSDMYIVASAGFYLFHDFGLDGITHLELADLLIEQCKSGMEETDIKPGILKCASANGGMNDEMVKKHAAIGITQKETGLPLYVHCEHGGNIAHEQIDVLLENGADAKKIIIGHCAARPDFEHLESILKEGCCISMDQVFFRNNIEACAKSLVKACQTGYTEKILVSNDYCIHNDFSPRNLNGLQLSEDEQAQKIGYVFDEFYEAFMMAGGKQEDWDKITTQNVAEVLDV